MRSYPLLHIIERFSLSQMHFDAIFLLKKPTKYPPVFGTQGRILFVHRALLSRAGGGVMDGEYTTHFSNWGECVY